MIRQVVLNHFKHADPVIHDVLLNTHSLELVRPSFTSQDYFTRMCRDIIGQQLSVAVAGVIADRFLQLVGETSPGAILKLEDQALRDIGFSRAKVRYVKDLAAKVESGELNLKKLADAADEDVIEQLITVKGIGRWTAEMFLIFTLGREDVFSHGDLGLRRGIEKLYKLEKDAAKNWSLIEPIVTKWVPYKSYASLALWRSLDQ